MGSIAQPQIALPEGVKRRLVLPQLSVGGQPLTCLRARV